MNSTPRFSSSAEALAAVVAPHVISSPMGTRARKIMRVVMVLLGLFVLGSVAVGIFGKKKTKGYFQEESQTFEPYSNHNNPWGRR
jgi:preprotein translocase subunit SecG